MRAPASRSPRGPASASAVRPSCSFAHAAPMPSFASWPGRRRGASRCTSSAAARTRWSATSASRASPSSCRETLFPEEIQPASAGDGGLVTLGGGAAIARLINVMRTRGLGRRGVPRRHPGDAGRRGGDERRAPRTASACASSTRSSSRRRTASAGSRARSCPSATGTPSCPLARCVTRVRFRLRRGRPAEASHAAMDADLGYRKRTQPLSQPNFGSVFKNPPGDHAGRLIEIGRPQGARARRRADLAAARQLDRQPRAARPPRTWSALMELAQERVREATGIELEPEVKRVGVFSQHRRRVKKRIGVLMGGLSVEREVSFAPGPRWPAALRSLGYTVVEIDVQKDVAERSWPRRSTWPSSRSTAATARTAASRGCSSRCSSRTPARACSPRRWGWRRCSPSRSSWRHGIPTPRTGRSTTAEQALAGRDALPFPFPVVVKPSREGSSVGRAHLQDRRRSTAAAVEDAAKLRGRHPRRAVRQGPGGAGRGARRRGARGDRDRPAHEFYDYEAKYTAGSGTKYLFPAPLPPDQYARVNEVCLAAHRALGCRGRDALGRDRHARRWTCCFSRSTPCPA